MFPLCPVHLKVIRVVHLIRCYHSLQELAAVKAIEANGTITLDQIAVVLGKSRSTVKRIVNSLKEKGLLDREGARKTGRWILKTL